MNLRIFILVLIAISLMFVMAAHAQTNWPMTTNSVNYALQNPPESTAADIEKVLQDFHISISPVDITIFLLLLKALAGYYRNFALKNTAKEDVGPIQNAIAHIAGSSLPSTTQPTTQTKP